MAFVALAAAIAAGVFVLGSWNGKSTDETRPQRQAEQMQQIPTETAVVKVNGPADSNPPPSQPARRTISDSSIADAAGQRDLTTNKLERLNQVREQFRALANGASAAALKAAKAITNENERETALVTLATQWTHGELLPASARAANIQRMGLEAGIGIELAKNPEMASQAIEWANALTEGEGRVYLLETVAAGMLKSDPAAGFALSEGMTEAERKKFASDLFASWAAEDTEAALQWANGLDDPGERDTAIKGIRTSAPVGIGAVLAMKDGYPVINGLASGGPAELSGQIRAGDRIVALAQGDSAFADAHDMSLAAVVDLLRGELGTPVRLQVVGADTTPNSAPRTVTIIRDQIKFKR